MRGRKLLKYIYENKELGKLSKSEIKERNQNFKCCYKTGDKVEF